MKIAERRAVSNIKSSKPDPFRPPVNSDSGSGYWKGSAGILGEMQHAADGDVGLRLFPNKIDGVGETIDSGQAMERTALPKDLRHPCDQV
ncbi:MAG TPA: hypothetical protein VL069_13640 [Opitutus sp.]|nr:hypothetical protein [Opitutus sp.]